MKTLEEKIAVMQAKADGKPIEWTSTHGEPQWKSADRTLNILWDWVSYDFRVKPVEPARIVLQKMEDGTFRHIGNSFRTDRCAEFIELTPEVRAKLGL